MSDESTINFPTIPSFNLESELPEKMERSSSHDGNSTDEAVMAFVDSRWESATRARIARVGLAVSREMLHLSEIRVAAVADMHSTGFQQRKATHCVSRGNQLLYCQESLLGR